MAKKKTKSRPLGKLAPGQWARPVKPYGTLHGPGTLFMCTAYGEAKGSDGLDYELSTGGWGGPGPPIIRSKRTGQYFELSFGEIIDMARAAGIDEGPKRRKL